MTTLDFNRYVLCSCVAAMLAGCGGTQSPIGMPGAMPQSRTIAAHAEGGGFWMLPEAKSRHRPTGFVRFELGQQYDLSLSHLGKRRFEPSRAGWILRSFRILRSIKSGNVYSANYEANTVTEYARTARNLFARSQMVSTLLVLLYVFTEAAISTSQTKTATPSPYIPRAEVHRHAGSLTGWRLRLASPSIVPAISMWAMRAIRTVRSRVCARQRGGSAHPLL